MLGLSLAHQGQKQGADPRYHQWPSACVHDRPTSRRGRDQRRTSLRVAHLNPGRLPGPAACCQQFIDAVDLRVQEEDHTRGGGEALARGLNPLLGITAATSAE